MIDVALRTIEEQALDATADAALESAAHERRPVGRNAAAADSVGMGAEIDDGDIRRTLTLETHQLQGFVSLAKRISNIGIAECRVGLNRAILHAITANRRNSAAFARSDGKLRRREIRRGGLGDLQKLANHRVGILLDKFGVLRSVHFADLGFAAGMGVGAVHELARSRNSGFLFNQSISLANKFFANVQIVDSEHKAGLALPRNGYALGHERIDNFIREALVEIARHRHTHRRSYVDTGKSRLELAFGQRRKSAQ